MENEFRIEIPIEVKDNSSLERLQRLDSILAKIYGNFEKDKTAAQGAFSAVASGADKAAQSIEKVEDASDDAADAAGDLGESVSDAAGEYGDLGEEAQQAGRKSEQGFRSAGDAVDKFSQRIEKSRQNILKAFGEKVKLTIAAIDKASPALKSIGTTVKNLTGKAWRVAVKMTDFVTAPFRKLYRMITSPIAMTISMAGLSLGASSFVSTFNDFTAGMSNVKALSGATEEQFARLTATAKELGATTKFTATEASEGMQYLAMAGWETNDIIAAMPGLLDLAAAGGTELGTAADIVSDVMTAMGMSAGEAGKAADIFARTATSTNTTIENLGETLKYAAPIAHSFGLELSEVSAITGMMANAGVKGSNAGTAIRSSLLAMASPAADAQEAMKKLGLSFADSNGKMKDMRTIISDLSKAFSGLSEQEKLAYADSLFGKYASSGWLGVISQGADEYERLFTAIDQSEGAAKEMANTQLDNLAGDMTLLQSAADGMKISLMEKIGPYLRKGVQWLTSKIPAVTEFLTGLADKAIDKFTQLKEFISGVFNSSDFQNAEGFAAKFFVAWDKIIAEPFSKWWEGGGRDTILAAVGKLGKGIGDMYHGIISGIFAALKGEDIDFEGLNITGLAKAGAEAAKEFVASFMDAFDLGGLWDNMPGLLKTGLLAFGGFKVGGTALSLAKDIGTVKLAFNGVSTAAATTAGTIGKTVGVFGGLKTALAAIPGWGWVAAAALMALTIAAVEYSKAQERERQSILHLGDDAKAAAEQYEESAKNVREAADLIDGIHTIEIQIERGENYTTEITEIQADLAVISDRKHYITLLLQGANYTEKEVADCKKKLDEVNGYIAYIEAQLAAGTITPEEAAEYQKQLEVLQGQRVELEAQLAGSTLTKEEVEQYQQELEALKGKEVELKAKLAEDTVRLTQVTEYMTELSALKGREEEIKMNLEKGVTPEEAEQYMQELEVIHGRTEEITIKLNGLGVTTIGILYAESLLNQIDGMEAEADVLLKRSGLSKTDIENIKTELKGIKTREAEIKVTMEGSQMTEEEVKAVKDELAAIENKTANIEAAMTGDLSEDEVKKLAEEYQKLKSQWAYLTLKLSGAGLDDTQLAALAAEYAELESKEATITADLAEAGMSKGDIQSVFDLYAGIGDKTAELTISFSTGSLKTEDLEKADAALQSMYERLAELSGGAFTAEDLASGDTSLEQAKEIAEQIAETSLITTRAMVEKAKPNVGKAMEQEAQYNVFEGIFSGEAEQMDDTATQLMRLELDRQKARALYGLYSERYSNGTMDEEAFDEFVYSTFPGIQERYKQLTGNDVTGEALLGEESPFDFWTTDFYGKWYRSQAEKYGTDADQQHNTLVDLYRSEKTLAEGEATFGTGYIGRSIEELAKGFGGLDSNGIEVFAKALAGLNEVNLGAEYIGDQEKVSIDSILQQAQQSILVAQIQDMLNSGNIDISKINEEFSKQNVENAADAATALETISGLDYASTLALFEGLGGNAQTASEQVKATQAALDKLAGEYNVTINITQNGSTDVSVPGNANGGIYDNAFLSLVAEDGPEAIIPLGSKRRDRGLALWEQAGRLLGVNEYAEGGILAPYAAALASLPEDGWGSGDSSVSGNGGNGNTITVSVSANPTFAIESGNSPDDIVAILKTKQKELAEILGSAFADELEDIVSNMV